MKRPVLIMTILARNEGDIIEKNIKFHLNHGVDFIIATDNNSIDNTREIFAKYQKKGKLHLIDEPGMNIAQSKWNNRMAQLAIKKYKADIVFHCDADEFWFPKKGDLKTEIWNSSVDVLLVDLVNVLLENRSGIESFPRDTKYAVINPLETDNFQESSKKENFYLFRYPSKVIFKTNKGLLEVSEGNHSIVGKNNLSIQKAKNIHIFHFPLRSKSKFYRKVINYGKALEKNNLLSRGISWHIRRWFKAYKQGKIDEEYNKLTIIKKDALRLQQKGIVEFFNYKSFFNADKYKKNDWEYFIPWFEYEKEFQDISWPWVGHKLFSYDLIRNFKPKKVVELGTHKGTSLFSFCQAVKDENLDTVISAIDTWRGDKQSGFYGDDIHLFVKKIINEFYQNVKVELIKRTFDEAVSKFEDESIDILHIDGLHTYEAVKHDFNKWFFKVKNNGIILLHDIKVGELDFGVHKFWGELKSKYQTIEFHHSFGLGVLFKGEDKNSNKMVRLEKELQLYYYYAYEKMKNDEINNYLALVKEKSNQIQQKNEQIHQKNNQIKELEKIEKLSNTFLGKLNWALHNPKKLATKYKNKAFKMKKDINKKLNLEIDKNANINNIQVYGQRCSGTNYLQELLKLNIGNIKGYQKYGWKHAILRKIRKDNQDTLFVVVLRNPFDWIRSLHKNPHHAHPSLKGISFSNFIREKWVSVYDEDAQIKNNDPRYMTEMMIERDPATNKRFANALDMRSKKIKYFLELSNKVKNIYYINLEDLQKNYEKVIKDVSKKYNLKLKNKKIINIKTYKGYRKNKYRPKIYEKISREDLNFIKNNLDWDLEEKIGYYFEDYLKKQNN